MEEIKPKNQRRNNPAEMRIIEQLEKLREEMCDDYCRYKDLKKHGKISQETFETICEYDCPLNKI